MDFRVPCGSIPAAFWSRMDSWGGIFESILDELCEWVWDPGCREHVERYSTSFRRDSG